MVEDGTVFVLDWCLDLDLVSFYFNYETQKMLNLYTAMSSVYLFQSCWTFSDWFSPYLMNSWSRANLSRSNRQRGVVAEYSPWTRLMWREYSGAECRCPVLDVHRRDGHSGSLMLVQKQTSGLEGALLCWCWKDRWTQFSISVPSLSSPSPPP